MTDKRLYIYIKSTEKIFDADGQKGIMSTFKKEHLYFDVGQAIYWFGFGNDHYTLIGILRDLFNDPLRSELFSFVQDDKSIIHLSRHNMVAIWQGKWTPLEKIGFLGSLFTSHKLSAIVSDIMNKISHDGTLGDRN